MKRIIFLALLLSAAPILAQEKDRRLTEAPKHYNLKYFPWTPPATKEAWEKRRPILKEQLLVSQGLWPMPEKAPLNAVVHGKVERDGYTVEKVFFVSHPGHYVTGNLYRPTNKTGKLPAVLYTHGHWQDARLSTAKSWASDKKSGAEATEESSKFFHQAGCVMLARLGCVVFHYDMVGNSDSMQIKHREGFKDVDAQLRLQTFMNLQTWNSIRAVDFVQSLPDVDPNRIGITGASGGGTQSFILAACDERVTAAFPAVMVSTSMQGGCICENCAYLRVGTTNIELAALIAPRPLGMTAADDWTKELETKGLPELKSVYKLYGAEDKVMGRHLSFPHNYNQPSREVMYNFFNEHLKLGHNGTITEMPFTPVLPKNLTVYDDPKKGSANPAASRSLREVMSEGARLYNDKADPAGCYRLYKDALLSMRPSLEPGLQKRVTEILAKAEKLPDVAERAFEVRQALDDIYAAYQSHPLPKDAADAATLKRTLTAAQKKQLQLLMPKDPASLAKFQKIEHGALRAMMTDDWSAANDVAPVEIHIPQDRTKTDGVVVLGHTLTRKGQGERVRMQQVIGSKFYEESNVRPVTVVWVHPEGTASLWKDDKLVPAARAIVDKGAAILAVDVFRTGANAKDRPTTNMKVASLAYAGYFYGYNRALVAERVHDILTAVASEKQQPGVKTIHLVGFEKAGPWVVLARGLCGDAVARTAADLNGFDFANVKDFDDEMMLPGALKYGGLYGLAGTIAPHVLYLHNAKGTGSPAFLQAAYQAAGKADRLQRHEDRTDPVAVVNWLLR